MGLTLTNAVTESIVIHLQEHKNTLFVHKFKSHIK